MRVDFVKAAHEVLRQDPQSVFITGDLGYAALEAMSQELGPRFINAGVSVHWRHVGLLLYMWTYMALSDVRRVLAPVDQYSIVTARYRTQSCCCCFVVINRCVVLTAADTAASCCCCCCVAAGVTVTHGSKDLIQWKA